MPPSRFVVSIVPPGFPRALHPALWHPFVMQPIRVGVSACLLGERVRYDGDHRRDRFLCERLGRRFAWVLICPETEAGFGVPRETLRLVGGAAAPRMLGTETGRDRTREMLDWALATVETLEPLGLCGFVLKRGSPSCGLAGVKLYATADQGEEPRLTATGLFAGALAERYPELPLVDEEMLADRNIAAGFLRRVRARWRDLEREGNPAVTDGKNVRRRSD